MFCILITIFVGTQIVGEETVPECYPTYGACQRDAPRVAHRVIPVEGRTYAFRCVMDDKVF